MGIFSKKKKTYVSSVVYPLGEEEESKRTDYLKYTVLNSIMQRRPLAESITQGYLRGQGMSLRQAFSYARDKYTNGLPASAARYMDKTDREVLTAILAPKHPGSTFDFLTVVVGTGDFEWWAERHLAEEYGYDRTTKLFDRPPQGVAANAAVTYDLEASGIIRILFMNPAPDTTVKTVTFRPTDFKLMGDYVHACYQTVQNFNSGVTTTTRPAAVGETDSVTVVVTVVERSGETQTTTHRTNITIAAGVATVRVSESTEVRSRPKYFLYEMGLGTYPELDAWKDLDTLTAPYYPAVPLRVNNVDVTKDDYREKDLFKTSKKLLDRVGIDIDDVADNLRSSEGLKDIDYAFVVFGVDIKGESPETKRYLYKYFEYLRSITAPDTTKANHSSWASLFAAGNASGPPKINAVQIYSEKDRANNYDILLQWDYIDTTIKSGQIYEGAGVGDCDVTMSTVRREYEFRTLELTMDSSILYARRQIDADTYEEMEISGLYFENFIYKGKSISISAFDAFNDKDEEGFIIPMNHQVLRQLSLRDVTDLSYHCMYLVLNCYKVVKQKWYQTTLFKIIMVIIAIIIIVVTWGAGTPAAVGMLAAVFTAAGVALLIAQILAATIYVLAMMVIANLLTKVAVAAFGEQWGAIIAAIVMIYAGDFSNIGSTAATTANTGITAMQVMQATTAILTGYGQYLGFKAQETYKDITKLQEEYEKKMDELQEMMDKMLGTNTDLLDITGMTEATYQLYFEPMDTFLSRTLMTGSDVVEITNGHIENFSDLGLRLPTS